MPPGDEWQATYRGALQHAEATVAAAAAVVSAAATVPGAAAAAPPRAPPPQVWDRMHEVLTTSTDLAAAPCPALLLCPVCLPAPKPQNPKTPKPLM